MEIYKTPRLLSYKSWDIMEVIGPCQNAAYLDVGGGRQAMLSSGKIEYQKECISPEITFVQAEKQTKTVA